MSGSLIHCTTGQDCASYGQFYCGELPGYEPTVCVELGSSRGKQINMDGTGFSYCEKGKYATEEMTTCENCPNGKYNTWRGLWYCQCPESGLVAAESVFGSGIYDRAVMCDMGYFVEQPGRFADNCKTQCEICPRGKFEHEQGSSACNWCGQGYYGDEEGYSGTMCTLELCSPAAVAAGSRINNCKQCEPGTFQDNVGQESCKPCQPGGFNGAYKSVGVRLEDGTYGCTCAEPGYYVDPSDRTERYPCPAGSFSTGCATECTLCPVGTYDHEEGESACNPCGQGHYNDELGYTGAECTCSPAAMASGGKLYDCKPCVPGTFQDLTGQSACKQCQPGAYSNSYANVGMSLEDESYGCRCSSIGHYVSPEDQTRQQICPPGQYTDERCSSECKVCPVGTTKFSSGGSGCSKCALGSAQPNEGATDTNCPLCEIGKYSDVLGLAECKSCGIAEYNEERGRTSCDSCWTIGTGFGLKHSQCTASWIVLGLIIALVSLPFLRKLWKAYR